MGGQGEAVDPERTRASEALPAPPPPFVAPLPPPPPPRAVDPLAEPGVRAWHEIVTGQAAGVPLAAPRPRRMPWRTVTVVAVAAAVVAAAVVVVLPQLG